MTAQVFRHDEPPGTLDAARRDPAVDQGRLLHPAAPRVPLDRAELLAVAHGLAVSAPWWPGLAHPTRRCWSLLAASEFLEAWVISWPPGGSIELHDHGGSSGAVVVADGQLAETSVVDRRPGRIGTATSLLKVGASTAFGPEHVHDITNPGTRPAVSVHVYSPRLPAMTYYDLVGGRLGPGRSVPSRLGEAVP